MAQQTKTDNAFEGAKVDLRRRFLRRYGATSVFDCCQGDGHMWGALLAEFPAKYFGVDQKEKRGRLKVESSRILEIPGNDFDVVDIDTYGEPWKHLLAFAKTATRPATVFLTYGVVKMGGGNLGSAPLAAMGMTLQNVPSSLKAKLSGVSVLFMLRSLAQYDIIILDAEEAIPDWSGRHKPSARYFALRIEPRKGTR